jgi:TldD protein
MIGHTRRGFLATTSLLVTGAALGTRKLGAQSSRRLSASKLLPDPTAPAELRALATRALDAARQAGASYADVRVADRAQLELNAYAGGLDVVADLHSTVTYGIRVIVDGTWAFVHGSTPSVDAIATSAREAVTVAKGYARLTKRRVELAPAPVALGEWTTPIHEDPFSVPLHDHAAVIGAYGQAAQRVRHGSLDGSMVFDWLKETRVFASSEGSLTTQLLYRSNPGVRVMGESVMGRLVLPVALPSVCSGGFERVADPACQDEVKRATEDVVRFAFLPGRALDVGRYPIVFDGATCGMVLGRTLGAAVELDRVLGYEADASGTSFLSPPQDLLGSSVVSPLITLTGNRSMPTVTAVKWDDEGVEPHEFPIISAGQLVDYPSSRQTASVLQDWYARRNQPLRSHGCMVAPDASDPLLVRAPHLTVVPNTQASSIDDLCRGISHGILVVKKGYCSTDQQLASGSFGGPEPYGYRFGLMLEIERGRIVRRVEGNALEFRTKSLWQSLLVALGGTETVYESTFAMDKGMPWRATMQSVTTPAALFKDVNVISVQREF